MLKQTIIWTAMPRGSDGPLAAGTTLHLSVLASPRLWNDDPLVKLMKLNSFPDFLDWPALVGQATWQVEFGGGPTITAVPENANLRSDLWTALFKDTTDVIPFAFEDLTGADVLTFPSAAIHDVLKRVYQRAAIDPAYGAGRELPSNDTLADDPDLGAIARPVRPEPPFEPVDPDRGPVVIDGPEEPGEEPGDEPDDRARKGCLGCLGCLGLLTVFVVFFRFLQRLFRRLWQIFFSALPMAADPESPAAGLGGGGGGAGPQKAAFDQLTHYVAPTSQTSVPLPTQQEIADTYDFHKMVAALGDYPNLLRYMGLVVDLVVTLPANLPAGTGTIRVIPNLPLALATTHYSPKSHYDLGDGRFLARPRPANPEISHGLLRLNDAARFKVQQVDVAGGGVKLQNTATNLVGVRVLGNQPANSPDESGLAALRTAGISIVRPEKAAQLKERFVRSYALNSALALVDNSPLAPPTSGNPPPPADDELFAEDLVRGYRIDVWDDQSNSWHSLCRRVGSYSFLEPASGAPPISLLNEEDEGFVQMGSTEPLNPGATRVLRAHESLFTWDGWSLAAPRPGQSILANHTTGDVPNPAKTNFKLETSFRARPRSLPRLRYGYQYRLRARVVDLAGNSVFDPDAPAFADSQPEITPPFHFRRFEPVSPPPLLLREVPKEGESLERLTVRSAVTDPPATITAQSTERHIVPPKVSQLMIEQHRLFDGSPEMDKSQAAYDRASREAGSMTHRLNLATGNLELIPGVSKVEDPALNRVYWLQTNDSFDVAYLPDPFARGVLLLGLPGMASFDTIADGVNRLPFQGAWPDPKPFRLRLVGLPAGDAPAAPNWDAANRLLTVQLAQGETAAVRICSYFLPADLDQMAIWGWTEAAAPPDLAQLKAQAEAGRNWLTLPFRALILVHAVQQPLQIPQINPITIAPARQVGETAVSLTLPLAVDAKSTGKVDVFASWADPRDNPDDPANDPTVDVTPQEMHVVDLTLLDPADDAPAFNNVRHALGDTRYHRVTYTPIATTRFREHFPPAITGDPQNLIRPLLAEAPITRELDVPNAARPSAPRPQYILPTFQWSENVAGPIIFRTRRGGGLRVYLERPWYSSGAGELLGVLIRPPEISPTSELADTLRKYSSEWAMDPLWPAESVAPLRLEDCLNATDTGHHLSLAELAGQSVHVAGFTPQYDAGRGLWFADLELDTDRFYYPFVRLALARFQPISVPNAHLSQAVLADFIQVAPLRDVRYDTTHAGAANPSLAIQVRGPSYFYPDRQHLSTTLMVVRLEQQLHAGPEDEVNWTPIGVQLLDPVGQAAADMVWEGTVPLPSPTPSPLRVVLLEAELFLTDGRSPADALHLFQAEPLGDVRALAFNSDVAGASLLQTPARGFRIVFADAITLP